MSYPYLTTEIPGTGGMFKEGVEDFEVTEIPLYPPCGSGEHLYLVIEKRGLTTMELVRRLSKASGIPEREMGYAGMKDARGVTRQTVSIPRMTQEQANALDIPGVRILSAERHNNKLRLGHLAGNSFRIRLTHVGEDAVQRAEAVLGILEQQGVPNYFGRQRYGSQGNSALIGCALLAGDYEGAVKALIGDAESVRDEGWQQGIEAFSRGDYARALELFPGHCRTEREVVRTLIRKPGAWDKGIKSIHPRLVALYISACQSELFDRVVAARMPNLVLLEQGDIAFKHANGACFRVDDPKDANQRSAIFEISPTGPMFGRKMLAPEGHPGSIEAEVLNGSGLSPDRFTMASPYQVDGERRPLRVPLREVSAEMAGDWLMLGFMLPKGAYATSVLREIVKAG